MNIWTLIYVGIFDVWLDHIIGLLWLYSCFRWQVFVIDDAVYYSDVPTAATFQHASNAFFLTYTY